MIKLIKDWFVMCCQLTLILVPYIVIIMLLGMLFIPTDKQVAISEYAKGVRGKIIIHQRGTPKIEPPSTPPSTLPVIEEHKKNKPRKA